MELSEQTGVVGTAHPCCSTSPTCTSTGYTLQGILHCRSQVLQAVMARVWLKEKPLVVGLTVVGLKPIIDATRIVFGVQQAEGQAYDQDMTFAMTRILETTFESLFQAFIQAAALAGADKRGVLTVCDNMPKTWARASVRVPITSNMASFP